jgi:hypothetical protein
VFSDSSDDGSGLNQMQSDSDLEDGELEDDEQEESEAPMPEPEKPAEETKEDPPAAPTAIPSLLDLKLSPPRNGMIKIYLEISIEFLASR